MNGHPRSPDFEPRWPIALAILAVMLLLAVLPDRIRLLPMWVTYVIGFAMLIPIGAVGLTAAKTRWLRVERTVILSFFAVAAAVTLGNLANLINEMVYRSAKIDGLQLLTSSVAVWVTNVLMFSLLYWQIDRGGPEARMKDAGPRPDWLFPQEGAPAEDVPDGWQPRFIDYLYLGFSTATAFSTTDAMPLTRRAKSVMMLESSISLVTLAAVASRAINILGN
jgi:uncharacterized membrane protein